jgi:hypothetical protein
MISFLRPQKYTFFRKNKQVNTFSFRIKESGINRYCIPAGVNRAYRLYEGKAVNLTNTENVNIYQPGLLFHRGIMGDAI